MTLSKERLADSADDSTRQGFAERVERNQARLRSSLKAHYDFIVCGSGSSGSVVARRLAENPDVSVLLAEAGGTDNVPAVMQPNQWPTNIGSERDWGFQGQPTSYVNGRRLPFSMGKVLGGGSSINVMVWARGHKKDWDYFASEAKDAAWSYESVLNIYKRIEDWRGKPDPAYRGRGGPVFVQPAPDPNPIASATVEAAQSVGIPAFENPNGRMMESARGAAITDMLVRQGRRESIFRSYVFPYMDRPNLTVLTDALVTRLTFRGKRATGIEISYGGTMYRIGAAVEIVLSLGAIHTPKVLMQSGIGDEQELRRIGIPVVQHLPGVGRNFQDHVAFDSVWEYETALAPRNSMSEAIFFSTREPAHDSPDFFVCQAEAPKSSRENAARFGLPGAGWTLFGALAKPKSRGRLILTGSEPTDPILIESNTLSDPDDLSAAIDCVQLCREVGNSAPLRPFAKREVMPGNLNRADLELFIRDAATSFWHETGTAKMGQDAMSVVDRKLAVYGIENLRIADGSIMPQITTGNTMAPCVIIGERAVEVLRSEHSLQTTVERDVGAR